MIMLLIFVRYLMSLHIASKGEPKDYYTEYMLEKTKKTIVQDLIR